MRTSHVHMCTHEHSLCGFQTGIRLELDSFPRPTESAFTSWPLVFRNRVPKPFT